MQRSDDQPWSPFPVQDWSTLPPDPLGSAAVNPTWPAPEPPQRSWWRPLVAYGLVAALVAGAAFVASSVGVAARVTSAAGYLPSDGAVSYERTDTIRELKTVVGIAVTESARLSGVAGLLSTDGAFATKMLDEAFADRDRIQILRTTTTAINDPASTAQTIRFYRVTSGVELMGVSTPSEGYVYSPALVLLPADVRPGSQWNGAGSAGDALDYRSELRAEAGSSDCLSVTGEVRYLSKEGQLGRVVTIDQTWCSREGIVAESQSFADVRTTTSRIEPPEPSIQNTTNTPILWSAPQRWTTRSMSTISINPAFGQSPMVGSPSAVTPVRTESGLVIRPTTGPGDLVATTPKTLTEWTSIWRAHPGGTVLSLSAFGNVIIATTSNRQMVAYSDVGVRLWQLSFDDLAPTSPVRISDQDAVLVDLGGEVRRFDLSTGTVRWQHTVDSDVNVSPAAGAGLVVIMDRGGATTAYEQSTGHDRWDLQQMQGSAATVIGDNVIVIQDQTAHALWPTTGRHRWVRPIFGTLTDMASFAGQVVVATKSQSVILSGEGAVTQRLGPVLTLTPTQDHLVAWGATEAQVIARDGAVISRWDLPALTLSQQDRPAIPVPRGVLLFSNDWTFQVREDAG